MDRETRKELFVNSELTPTKKSLQATYQVENQESEEIKNITGRESYSSLSFIKLTAADQGLKDISFGSYSRPAESLGGQNSTAFADKSLGLSTISPQNACLRSDDSLIQQYTLQRALDSLSDCQKSSNSKSLTPSEWSVITAILSILAIDDWSSDNYLQLIVDRIVMLRSMRSCACLVADC